MTTKHVWFFMGWYSDNWWSVADPKIECNPQEMSNAMANITAFSVSFLANISDTRMTSTGMVSLTISIPKYQFIHILCETLAADVQYQFTFKFILP